MSSALTVPKKYTRVHIMESNCVCLGHPRIYTVKPSKKHDFPIQLTKSHFSGGETLSGEANLSCNSITELRDMLVEVEAVYEVYKYNDKQQYLHTRDFPIISEINRIPCCPMVLDAGEHSVKFAVKLPVKSPPSDLSTLFDDRKVIYSCKIMLKKNSIGEEKLESECEFQFSPQHRVLDFNSPQQVLVEKQFIGFMEKPNPKKALRMLKRATGRDSKIPIDIHFYCPRYGLRQDIPNSFDLQLKATSPGTMIINHLILDLEAFMKVAYDRGFRTRSRTYELFYASDITLSEKSMSLNSLMNKVLIPRVTPTHDVFGLHNQYYKLHLRVSVTQRSDDGELTGDIKRTFVVPVLSPFIVKSEDSEEDLPEVPPPSYDKEDEAVRDSFAVQELPSYDATYSQM